MAHVRPVRPAIDPRDWTVAAGALLAALAVALVTAAAPGWAGALSLLWLALIIVAWLHPAAGLAVVALAVPFEQRLAIPTLAGTLGGMEYCVWACAAGGLGRLAKERRVAVDRVAIAHLAVVVALALSIAAGEVRVLSWWETVQTWLLAWLVYLIARSMRPGRHGHGLIVAALAGGVLVNAAMAVRQLVTGAGPESFVVGGAVRVFGAFLHPNTLASYLAFVLPVLVALSMAPVTRLAWVARAGAVAGLVTLVLTQSRGGLLALAAAAIALVALSPRAIQRLVVVGAVVIAAALVAFGMSDRVPGIERFSTISLGGEMTQVTPETWGQLEREAHWGAAWSMLRSEPLTGVGAGEFNDHFREYTPEWRFRVGRGHAHNGYLQLGAEAGLPGLIAFVLWIGTIVVALWRRMLNAVGSEYLLAIGALGAAVAWCVDNLFEYQEVPSILVLFVLLVALGLRGADSTAPRSSSARREATGGVAS